MMIALYLPPGGAQELYKQVGPTLAMQGIIPIAPSDYHVTLALLPEEGVDIELVKSVCSDVALANSGIAARINGVGVFLETHKAGLSAVYANFDAPALAALRADLVTALSDAGLEVISDHGFTPHVTICYVDQAHDPVEIESFTPFGVFIDQLMLAWDNSRFSFDMAVIDDIGQRDLTMNLKWFFRQSDEEKAREARAKASGIAIKPDGSLTRPSRFEDVPDNVESWGDWTNYSYPLVPAARAQNAITRFNDTTNKAAAGYTDAEWAKIGRRIAAANEGKVYRDGKVVDAEEREISLDDIMSDVKDAFYLQFPTPDNTPGGWVREVFSTYVIVEGAPGDDYPVWKIPYTYDGGRYVFASRDNWIGGDMVFTKASRQIQIIRGNDDRVYWRTRSASAFLARDEMIISTHGLKKYTERHRDSENFGPLCLVHVFGLRVGTCLFSHMSGRILTEFGVFDDTPMGRDAAEYYQQTEEPHTVSIRWFSSQREGNVWLDCEIIERSILPSGFEADPVTAFTAIRGNHMDEQLLNYAKSVLPGVDLAEITSAIDEDTRLSTALEDVGLPTRQREDEPPAEPNEENENEEPERQQQTGDGDSDETPNESAEIVDMVAGMMSQFSDAMISMLDQKLDEMRVRFDQQMADTDKRIDKVQSLITSRGTIEDALVRAVAERASNSRDTQLSENDDVEIVAGGTQPVLPWAPDPNGPHPFKTSHAQSAAAGHQQMGGMPWAPNG